MEYRPLELDEEILPTDVFEESYGERFTLTFNQFKENTGYQYLNNLKTQKDLLEKHSGKWWQLYRKVEEKPVPKCYFTKKD